MTDLENKDVKIDNSADKIQPESEEKESLEKNEIEKNEKDTNNKSNTKESNSLEEKTKGNSCLEEKSSENKSESASEIKQVVIVKDNTKDENQLKKENEGVTKASTQHKDENKNKTEKNKDEKKANQDVEIINKAEGDKKPRKMSDTHVIKGKLDVLLKMHDNKLERKQTSDKEESSVSEISDDENKDKTNENEKDKSDENSSKKPKKDKNMVDGSKEKESKSLDKPAKKTKTDKKTNEKSSEKETSSALSDHLLNSLKSPEKQSGILQKKKSRPFWTWKRYFFILDGKLLSFYDPQKANEEQQQPNSLKGSIDLNIATSVKSKKPGLLKSNFPFSLARKSQGPINLATDTSEEREKWMKVIGDEIKRSNHHASEPELNKIGTEEENERKSATLPPARRSGSLPTINIQDEDSKSKDDHEKNSDSEEEKPVLIVPKKIRGVGVMNFVPLGAVKLKKISIPKKQEIEEKDTDSNSTDTKEKLNSELEKGNIKDNSVKNLQTGEENDSEIKSTTENKETILISPQKFTPQVIGIQLKKVANSPKSQEKKENGGDPVASEQKESEGLFGIKLKKTDRNLVTENDNTIKVRKRSVSPNIPLSKNLQSVVSKNKDDEDLENKTVCHQIKIDISNEDSENNKEVDIIIKTDQEIVLKKETLNEEDSSKESEIIKEKDFIKTNEISNKISINCENDQIPSTNSPSDVTNEIQIIENDENEKIKDMKNNEPCHEVDQDRKTTNHSSSEIAKDEIMSVKVSNDISTKLTDNELQNEECQENSSTDLSKEDLKYIKNKDDIELEVAETPHPKKEETKEPLNKEHDDDIKLDALSINTDKKNSNKATKKSKESDETDSLHEVETKSISPTIERKNSLKEKISGSGRFSFFKRKTSSSYDLQSKADKQKNPENNELKVEVTSHDKKRRPSAFAKLLQGITRGSKINMNDEPGVINKSNDSISTGSQKSTIDLNMEKGEDEQNKSEKPSPETPDKIKRSMSNEPIGEAEPETVREVEESLVVRRDFHIPYDESRYSSYSRNSNKSGDNIPPPSLPEKKGVRESSPVHDVPKSSQPISNMKEVIEANNMEDENVNKIDGYMSAEQIESVVHAKIVVKRKLSLVNSGNDLLLQQPNNHSNEENEQDRVLSFVSETSTESDPLTVWNYLGSSRSSSDLSDNRKSSLVSNDNNFPEIVHKNTSNNEENSQKKHSFISVTSIESDDPLPMTKFLGSDRSSSESGGKGTDSDYRHSKDLDSPSISEVNDPDLKAPLLRPNRPSSIISANRKSLTQPEFTVMEEGPLTPGGTNEVESKFELPIVVTKAEDSKIDCNSEDEHEDYFPVVGGGAVELRKSPNGTDKLLKDTQTDGSVRTSGIAGLKAYLDEIEDGESVTDSRIGINRLGQSIAVEKLKNEIK